MTDPAAIQRANTAHFLKHGPGLSYAYQTFVIARDPDRGMILLGGLGGMGVGTMWFKERPEHKNKAGYAEAKIESSAGGLGA